MSCRRRGRSRPYCFVLTGSSTELEVEQERDLTITGTSHRINPIIPLEWENGHWNWNSALGYNKAKPALVASLDRASSQPLSAEHGGMPADLHERYGGVKHPEGSLPLGQ
ncbi:hypothetical protein Bbelb_385320 [Branchiostoma belcheri]|nr:hypothetical protein Bbelb_385320 [Branchiostoma belcheri]